MNAGTYPSRWITMTTVFFTPDRKFLICQTHGATYDPATGYCVGGPCQGDSLRRLPVEVDDQGLWMIIEE